MLFVDEFPKTQSVKIVRRAVEATYIDEDIGDLSSIKDPEVLDKIENGRYLTLSLSLCALRCSRRRRLKCFGLLDDGDGDL